MLKLPKKEESSKALLKKEMKRQLKIMEKSEPESEEYTKALLTYKELHNHYLEEKKIVENRLGRLYDGLTTITLAVGTMSYEYWAPFTTKWANGLLRPFTSRKTF